MILLIGIALIVLAVTHWPKDAPPPAPPAPPVAPVAPSPALAKQKHHYPTLADKLKRKDKATRELAAQAGLDLNDIHGLSLQQYEKRWASDRIKEEWEHPDHAD